jgi:ABC-type multidrug transport system fused ATPase/permease subunit
MFGISWRLSMVTFMGLPIIITVSNLYGDYYKVSIYKQHGTDDECSFKSKSLRTLQEHKTHNESKKSNRYVPRKGQNKEGIEIIQRQSTLNHDNG